MADDSDEFLKLFDLQEIRRDVFLGAGPRTHWQRVFGGLAISQALTAATRTVDAAKAVHSMHSYFLLPGKTSGPIEYKVERLRDGASFASRQCRAIQDGKDIFVLMASYHASETGFEHSREMPDVPPPESLQSFVELQGLFQPPRTRSIFEYFAGKPPLEFRPVQPGRYIGADAAKGGPSKQQTWFKVVVPLPNEPVLHQAALAYASDMTLLDCTLVSHGRSVTDGSMQPASLDHTIWFHRPFRADEWLLYSQDSPNASGARGLAFGYIHTRNGELVATVAQEGLIRIRR